VRDGLRPIKPAAPAVCGLAYGRTQPALNRHYHHIALRDTAQGGIRAERQVDSMMDRTKDNSLEMPLDEFVQKYLRPIIDEELRKVDALCAQWPPER
jgi:hypothetical protein